MSEQTTRRLPKGRPRRVPRTTRATDGVGARVREARLRQRLSGSDLAAVLGLEKSQISKIETDHRRISVNELPRLAQALRVTPAWILGMQVVPTFAFAHRLSGASDSALAQTRAADVLNVEELLATHGLVEAPQSSPAGLAAMNLIREEFTAAPRTREEAQRQGRVMAQIVRDQLKLGEDEIGNLPDLIETHFATDVVLSPMGTGVDGLCAHSHDRAIIVASTDFDAGHVRFTLAHELGHHLLDDPREVIDEVDVDPAATNLTERRVNAFAAHLLLPREGVLVFLNARKVGRTAFDAFEPKAVRAAAALVGQFGVSVPATVFQLAEFGLITAADRWIDRLESLDASFASIAEIRKTTSGVRPPRRLLEATIDAAVAMRVGTGPLSVLLERDDEDALFREFIAPGIRDE